MRASITGGGTLALGGNTLTVPATGTAALLNVANSFSTGNQTIQTGADTTKGLIVKGNSATQSGDLQQWQQSNGTVLASISSVGFLATSGINNPAFLNWNPTPGNLYQITGNTMYNNMNGGVWQTNLTWKFDNLSSGTNLLWTFTPTFQANTTSTLSGTFALEGINLKPTFGNGASFTYNSANAITALAVRPTININAASTGSYVGLLVNATETSVGAGTNYLAKFQTGGSNKMVVTSTGKVGIGTGTPNGKLDVIAAPTATGNYGLVNIGPAATAFDGSTAGFFAGSANGTQHAINAASGFTGNLADWQVGGVSAFKVDASGNITARSVTLSGRVNGGVVALTDAATITTDASLGNTFRVTLGGNRTLANPTNGTDGQKITYELIQDATGNRTIALDTNFALGTDISTVTLTATAGKRDFLTCIYNATTGMWYVINVVHGY